MYYMSFLFLFLVLCSSQQKKMVYASFNSDSQLLNFGFHENGKFDMQINSSVPGQIMGFFASSSEVKQIRSPIANVCNTNRFISKVNFTHGYANMSSFFYHWTGNVYENSVYSLYLINCDSKRSIFTVDSFFSNPESFIDSRDDILLHLYLIFALTYFVFSVIWLFNAAVFSRFRVPLHTIFLFLPIIRCIVLLTTSSVWGDWRNTGNDNISKIVAMLLLNLLYYALLFIGVSFASTGFFIYRKFSWKEATEVIFSSAFLSIGFQIAQYVTGVQQAFLSIGVFIFSLIWYLKQCIVSTIIASKLIKQMKEPQVVAKIKLALKFATNSFFLITITIIFTLYSAVANSQRSICSSILEIGLILNSILQMKTFLLKKEYLVVDKQRGYKVTIAKPKVICTPNGSELVLFVQEVYIDDYY
ncbi:hypothetical protein M9Y10_015011 [Tritrichomonas musculus]|uniref:Intimal thickness related receptor IRP domain-containing protein n=1 Tax=Tritrichomonas musculus TaxID=1915356 RepID=A0ABR2L2W9_9EUKA